MVSEVALARCPSSPSQSRWMVWHWLTVISRVVRARIASWFCQAQKTHISTVWGRSPVSRGCPLGRPLRWTPIPPTCHSPAALWFGSSACQAAPSQQKMLVSAPTLMKGGGPASSLNLSEGVDNIPSLSPKHFLSFLPIRDALCKYRGIDFPIDRGGESFIQL